MDLSVAVETVAMVILSVSVSRQQAYISMVSEGRMGYVSSGHDKVELDCEFFMEEFSMFGNPIFWMKRQLDEQPMQINFMGNILPPFFDVSRFRVEFTTPSQHHYNPKLIILGVSLEDSGNYTCEVHGRKSLVLASVTHIVYVRASLQEVYFTNTTMPSSSSTASLHLPHQTPSILSHQPHQPPPTHNSSFSSSSSSSTSSDVRLRHMTFVAGVPRPVRCVGVGGYPPPRLNVYLGDEDVTDRFAWLHSAAMRGLPGLRLMTFRSERTAEGFVVRPENDGQQMRCLATVADFSSQFARMAVRVHYSPIINCKPVSAAIGDRDVCVTCEVKARPDVNALYWLLDANGTTLSDGQQMAADDSWAVVLIRTDEVLELKLCFRRVRPPNFRSYRIFAENNIGSTTQQTELVQEHSPLNADHHHQHSGPDAEPEKLHQQHHQHTTILRTRSTPSSSSSLSSSSSSVTCMSFSSYTLIKDVTLTVLSPVITSPAIMTSLIVSLAARR